MTAAAMAAKADMKEAASIKTCNGLVKSKTSTYIRLSVAAEVVKHIDFIYNKANG